MKSRKVKSKSRYLLAFMIGTIIFIIGFAISYSLSYAEYQRISTLQGKVAYSIFEDKLMNSLFDGEICSDESYRQVSEDLGFQGRIIDDLERKFGKDDSRVLFRKKFYTVILLEHFEFVNSRNEQCASHINTILFFYSNQGPGVKESERVGDLLSSVHGRNENLVIYSFDVDLDSDLIRSLKEKYVISGAPEIVINEDVKVISPKHIDEVEKYLNN